jgi:hypothetical protein
VLRAMFRTESIALVRIVAGEAQRFPEIGRLFDEMTRTSSAAIVAELAHRLGAADAGEFADDFIALVRGDLYFRVLIGAVPVPDDAALVARAREAVARLLKAYSA